jgi:hypothetical protein
MRDSTTDDVDKRIDLPTALRTKNQLSSENELTHMIDSSTTDDVDKRIGLATALGTKNRLSL